MSEHDPKKAAPPQGPVPDPHADKPAPLPDAHSRPAPDADVIRPDQDEELGPAVELFRAAGAEAAAEVLRTDEARAEAVRRGAEPEGVEAAQIFSLLLATFVALVMSIVGIFFMVDYLAYEQLER